jgi:transcriptional regulator of arginine metabolism
MYTNALDCIKMKARRQALILRLVDREPVRSQEQLRRGLRAVGIAATQATISRDIKELGLVKRAADGAYQRATAPPPAAAGSPAEMMRAIGGTITQADQVQQLVLLKTPPGQANATAVTIDRANLPEIVGTIAGDDTILVVLRDNRRAAAFAGRVRDAIGR